MTARDQLADRIALILDPDAKDPVAQEMARNGADGVIGMIKPLHFKWIGREHAYAGGSEILLTAFTSPKKGVRMWRLRLKGQQDYTWHDENQLHFLVSRINARYRAQILAALGLDAGEGRT